MKNTLPIIKKQADVIHHHRWVYRLWHRSAAAKRNCREAWVSLSGTQSGGCKILRGHVFRVCESETGSPVPEHPEADIPARPRDGLAAVDVDVDIVRSVARMGARPMLTDSEITSILAVEMSALPQQYGTG